MEWKRCSLCLKHEGCHICHKCLEMHCTCMIEKQKSACYESRACSCVLFDPKLRCQLCLGCQQQKNTKYSHCKCIQHQKQLHQLEQRNTDAAEQEDEVRIEIDTPQCNCFSLHDQDQLDTSITGIENSTREYESNMATRRKRIRQLRQAVGIPAIESLYHKKLSRSSSPITDYSDSSGLENEMKKLFPQSLRPYIMTAQSSRAHSHCPLYLDQGASYMESIEERNDIRHFRRCSFPNVATQVEEILAERGLENLLYDQDQATAKPLDNIIDYLMYISSVKIANIPEMIGSFEDSAAVAAAIVFEEYTKQLFEDSTQSTTDVVSKSNDDITQWVLYCLQGFDWKRYLQSLSTEIDKDTLVNGLCAYLLEQFECIQNSSVNDYEDPEYRRIKTIIKCEVERLLNKIYDPSDVADNEEEDNTNVDQERQDPALDIRVSRSIISNLPVYQLDYKDGGENGLFMRIEVDGLASREAAIAESKPLLAAVSHQHEKNSLVCEASRDTDDTNDAMDVLFEQLNAQIKEVKGKDKNLKHNNGQNNCQENQIQSKISTKVRRWGIGRVRWKRGVHIDSAHSRNPSSKKRKRVISRKSIS